MNFTKESVQKAVTAIESSINEFDNILKNGDNLSIEDAAQILISNKFNDAQIEAEEIVNDLKKGLEKFDEQFNKNKETESLNVKECLENATKGNTPEERKKSYVSILTAIELLNIEDKSDDVINAKIAENEKFSEEELIEKIEEAINSSFELSTIADSVKNGLNTGMLSQLADIIKLSKDEYRFKVALFLYIEQRNGNLKLSDSEFAIPAEQIGVLAGAAIETIIANNDLNKGDMDMKTWQKVMKWIIGAALGILLTYGSLVVVANVTAFVMGFVLTILGTSTIAFILSVVLALYTAWKVSDLLVDGWAAGMDAYLNFYDEHIAGVTAKVTSWIEAVKTWVKNITAKKEATTTTDNAEQSEANQIEANNEQNAANNNNDNQELSAQDTPVFA